MLHLKELHWATMWCRKRERKEACLSSLLKHRTLANLDIQLRCHTPIHTNVFRSVCRSVCVRNLHSFTDDLGPAAHLWQGMDWLSNKTEVKSGLFWLPFKQSCSDCYMRYLCPAGIAPLECDSAGQGSAQKTEHFGSVQHD